MSNWEKKNNWKYKAIMTLVTFLVFLCFYAFDTDAKAFTQRAGFAANLFGIIFFIIGGVAVWLDQIFTSLGEKTGWTHGVGWAGGTLLGCVVSAGFNFDYFGL